MIAFRPTQARCTLLFCLVALVVTINALPAFAGIAVTGPASSSALGTGAFTSQQAFLMRPVLTSVSCPSTKDCVAVGYTSSGAGAIVVTTNGGATWTIRKSPPESVGLNAIMGQRAETVRSYERVISNRHLVPVREGLRGGGYARA